MNWPRSSHVSSPLLKIRLTEMVDPEIVVISVQLSALPTNRICFIAIMSRTKQSLLIEYQAPSSDEISDCDKGR